MAHEGERPAGVRLPLRPVLADLMRNIEVARRTVRARRSMPVVPLELAAAHHALLLALEAYADELCRRRIPVPPRLRDELRLQRRSRSSSSHRGWTG